MHVAPQRPEFVGVEDLVRRVESQHDAHRFALRQQRFGQLVERRHAYAAAHQQGPPRIVGGVEAVAESRQQVQLRARRHAAHLLRTSAHNLIDEREGPCIAVAHRNRTAQVAAFERDIDELSRTDDPFGIALQHHAPHRGRQRLVRKNLIDAFLIHVFPFDF